MDIWDVKKDLTGRLIFKYTGDTEELVIQFEDIFREINKLSDFYRYTLTNEKSDITKFLLNGDHPMIKAIYDEMKERFDVPVDMIPQESGKKDSLPLSLFLPLGLALKGVQ